MSTEPRSLNPQAEQMADESMVRTLAAQAAAIWPQEEPLFARYGLPEQAQLLDAGCGTGEVSSRLAQRFPGASVLGVDILPGPLELARRRHGHLAPRLRFEQRSIFELKLEAGTFDLVVCRHVLQSIPHPERVLAELARVTRKGGHLHLIVEDYGMIHFPPRAGPDELFPTGPREYGEAIGVDVFIGRNAYSILSDLGLEAITVDYAVVDTVRVPRETFVAIWEAWRDGFVQALAEHSHFSEAQARERFEAQLTILRDPTQYAVWLVPIVSARVP